MLKICVTLLALIIILWFSWRLASQRHQLPCPSWLSWFVEMDNPFTKINRAKTIVKHAELTPGMNVANIGCGPGRVTLPAAHAVGKAGTVTAVDLQKNMLKQVKAKAQKEALTNITYTAADISSDSHGLQPESYDRVLLVAVLGEIPNQEAAFHNIYTTLKPGGILCVTELIFDPHFQSKSAIRTLAKKTGFTEHACFGGWHAYNMLLKK